MSPEVSATIAREVIAETLLIFDIGLLLFIAVHLRRELRVRGFNGARTRLGNQAAVAVAVHVIGLSLIRGWTTVQYFLRSQGTDPDVVQNIYQVPMIGLALAVLGMACCIRIFSPARWGNWGWVLTFMAAVGFVGWMQAR